jgi:sugar phosphate isomerase/epimerase
MTQTRRDFLATLGGATLGATALGTVALSVSCRSSAQGSAPRGQTASSRLGIQLYTLRRQATADLPGVLSQLATIGYREVELAGYYNRTAAEFRDLLKANGLSAPSGHIAIDLIERAPDKTFADARTVGHEWITVPSLPRGRRETSDDWKRVANQFNSAASKAKAAGFKFAFHNHNDIVKAANGILPIDILMAETDPSLVSYQMDVFWAVAGGADPLALLKKFPGRFRMLHIKDGTPPFTDATQTDVGKGAIDFKPILAAATTIEHLFVESDSASDPIAFARNSFDYLKRSTS